MTTVTEPTRDTLQKSTDENQSNSNSNSEQLIKTHELDRAPWVIVEHEKGYFVAIGQQLTEDFTTLTEAIELVQTTDFTMQLIITLASAVFELKNQTNNN